MFTKTATQPISRRTALARVLGFVKPYGLMYGFGLLLYCGQSFLFAIVDSLLLGALSAAMLAGDIQGLAVATGLGILGWVVLMLLLMVAVPLYVRGNELAGRDLKARLFHAFVRTSVEDGAHSGEALASMNTDAGTALELLDNPMCAVLGCIISILFSSVVIFGIDYRMGLLALGVGLLSFLIQSRFSKPLASIGAAQLDTNASATKTLSDVLNGGVTLRAYNLQEAFATRFEGDNHRLLELGKRLSIITGLQSLFTTLQGWLTLSGVFTLGGILVARGSLQFSQLMMVPALCQLLAQAMSQIGTAWAGVQAPLEAAKRIAGVMDRGAALEQNAARRAPAPAQWDGDATLRLDTLTFTYNGSETATLRDVSLTVPPGALVALVGVSGSGKSTLLRAAAGLYERAHLGVSLGSLSYDTTPPAQWRQSFAFVDQSCTLFDMSIAENIALGRPGAAEEEIQAAARLAAAHDFITALPQGYATPCGEQGASLSGGQRQRIAIARALVRGAPILVFDEATSALDAESEALVLATIEGLRGSHTVLMTTHNLRAAENADIIVVMENGRVAEQGTHAQLLAAGGPYAALLAAARQE